MVTQANEVQLTCGCKRVYVPQPSVGDLVYCRRHPDSVSQVQTVMSATWAARCQTRCRYSRTFGMDDVNAHRSASAHVTKNPTHVVEVSKGGELISVVSTAPQETLSGLDEDAGMPF